MKDPFCRIELARWLAKELKIDNLEEWYRISDFQIRQKVKPKFFKEYSLEKVLLEAYPQHEWDLTKLHGEYPRIKRASQRMVVKMIKEIFAESGFLIDTL